MPNHPFDTPFATTSGAANGHWDAPSDDGDIGYECALPFLVSDLCPATGLAPTWSVPPLE